MPGYRSSHSTTQNFFRRSTMVANIFEGFEPPSKKFLDTPLLYILFSIKESEYVILQLITPFSGVIKKFTGLTKVKDWFKINSLETNPVNSNLNPVSYFFLQ